MSKIPILNKGLAHHHTAIMALLSNTVYILTPHMFEHYLLKANKSIHTFISFVSKPDKILELSLEIVCQRHPPSESQCLWHIA